MIECLGHPDGKKKSTKTKVLVESKGGGEFVGLFQL